MSHDHVLANLNGQPVTLRTNLGAGEEVVSGILAVPASMFAPHLHCPECGSATRDQLGDGLDLEHLPDCELGEELASERAADEARLAALREDGQTEVFKRLSTEAEVDLFTTQSLTAEGAPVVVQPADDGGRRRWWPTLADRP